MARRDSIVASDMAYLQQESLKAVLILVTMGVYSWCAVLFFSRTMFGPAWWGPGLAISGLAVALLIRDRNLTLAGAALVIGLAMAACYNMWFAGMRAGPYMLVVVVNLAGLLFGLQTVVWMTILCSLIVFSVGVFHWDIPLFSVELVSPVLAIVSVGILSSLAVRNLYLTLHWAWDRVVAAQRNEEELRDRRGELARALKALDEAYQRLEHLNYDLARAREVAEEARLIKQQFVTNVSHELRTPLNVIVAFSEMMYLSPERYGDGPMPPEFRGDIREVYRSSQHLLRLIDDVLDLSQIEAGRLRMYLESTDLRDVVAEAIDIVRPLVRSQDIELRVELPPELPAVVVDRARVRQVLLNLLNNARRFTEHGSIVVKAASEKELVVVTVADTGVGIPPDEHKRIFEEFRQLDGSTTRRQDGSGLGLAISKRFVEMHGGSIWVESNGVPGQGARFHFTLPLRGSELVKVSTLHKTHRPAKPPASRGRTLLLLGQDPGTVRMLEHRLEEYQVVPVGDVSEIPTLIDELHVRAIVVNSAHEGLAQQQVRELQWVLPDSPMPVITCPLVEEHHLGQHLGVVDYLVKPIARETLVSLLARLDGSVRRILVVDNDPRMARLLSRMLQMTADGYEVVRAYGGEEGLQKMRAQRPDLVLLDLVMPEMDGYGVLSEMRKDTALRNIPVAAITAHTRTPEEERMLGGRTLSVSTGTGFTNVEVLDYLRGILDGINIPVSLRRDGQTVESG